MSKTSARQKQCLDFQDKMAKKRERDFWHQEKWGNQVKYYRKWEKVNTKYDEWTSPRYYESNNELIEKVKKDREKVERLEKRREKLKKLYSEDDASYEIEIMLKKAKSEAVKQQQKFEEIPTELLKDVNVGLKLEEDDKRRREAELQLYHQWRNNNPILCHEERRRNTKDVKLSWLDQQIEKRMKKEKEEEECKKILRERDKNIEEQKRKDQIISEEIEKKNKELQEYLLKQMEEINLRQKVSEDLQDEEKAEIEKQMKIAEFQEKLRSEEIRRQNKECALYNLKQHKIKLKRMAREIEENIENETDLIRDLVKSQAAERIKDEHKKGEVKRALDEFLEYSKEQKFLEKRRQEYLDFVFDSEAKITYEKQKETWDREEKARQALIKDVLDTINQQIQENIRANKDKQKELLLEREKMLEDVEKYEKEIEENKKLELERKQIIKKELAEQITDKKTREKKLKEMEKRKIDIELENIRKEEDRLKKEIIKIQNSHAPLRYARKKPWY
ncbi:trichoplein keratin filament-binding protein family member [Holotrichia oblita]|uniref:Trichoplein keratin filament-binding protein family member n=1 Tax=Holotrichia oblita TaxID=644536 RepID=A0ACB9SH82_HOLOL|nr:trichoplein keratin filament-binding protein family member [Holotrichia oblita]